MEKNGKASHTKRTKHINIQFFCVTDKVKSGKLHAEHCPTKEMIGDHFSEPLVGALFQKSRNMIPGGCGGDMGKCRRACKQLTAESHKRKLAMTNGHPSMDDK